MMQHLLNVMPELKHAVENLLPKRDQDPDRSIIITFRVLAVNGTWRN
jgi:hypothetical protein